MSNEIQAEDQDPGVGRIHRRYRRKPFTCIDNDLAQNLRISGNARALLIEMLSRPPEWEFWISKLSKGQSYGQHVMGKLLQELRWHGYLKLFKVRTRSGILLGSRYELYDEPLPPEERDDVPVPAQELKHRKLDAEEKEETFLEPADGKKTSPRTEIPRPQKSRSRESPSIYKKEGDKKEVVRKETSRKPSGERRAFQNSFPGDEGRKPESPQTPAAPLPRLPGGKTDWVQAVKEDPYHEVFPTLFPGFAWDQDPRFANTYHRARRRGRLTDRFMEGLKRFYRGASFEGEVKPPIDPRQLLKDLDRVRVAIRTGIEIEVMTLETQGEYDPDTYDVFVRQGLDRFERRKEGESPFDFMHYSRQKWSDLVALHHLGYDTSTCRPPKEILMKEFELVPGIEKWVQKNGLDTQAIWGIPDDEIREASMARSAEREARIEELKSFAYL